MNFQCQPCVVYRVYTKEWCGFKSEQEIYFTPYTGTTHTVSSSNCPSFSCVISNSFLMLTAGPRGKFPRWRRSRKRLSVCSVLRCQDLWLQCSVGFVHGLEETHLPFTYRDSWVLYGLHVVEFSMVCFLKPRPFISSNSFTIQYCLHGCW